MKNLYLLLLCFLASSCSMPHGDNIAPPYNSRFIESITVWGNLKKFPRSEFKNIIVTQRGNTLFIRGFVNRIEWIFYIEAKLHEVKSSYNFKEMRWILDLKVRN